MIDKNTFQKVFLIYFYFTISKKFNFNQIYGSSMHLTRGKMNMLSQISSWKKSTWVSASPSADYSGSSSDTSPWSPSRSSLANSSLVLTDCIHVHASGSKLTSFSAILCSIPLGFMSTSLLCTPCLSNGDGWVEIFMTIWDLKMNRNSKNS